MDGRQQEVADLQIWRWLPPGAKTLVVVTRNRAQSWNVSWRDFWLDYLMGHTWLGIQSWGDEEVLVAHNCVVELTENNLFLIWRLLSDWGGGRHLFLQLSLWVETLLIDLIQTGLEHFLWRQSNCVWWTHCNSSQVNGLVRWLDNSLAETSGL